jgi:predicted negative regulator of RcsB-dependent stress response|tara:strand:- start:117 stop:689 length:573 start_codon:yes stop_codon:yes gene_type:complete
MSSEKINNNFQNKLKKFFKENTKKLLILIGVIIVILFSFLVYKNLQEKNNLAISEKYTRASISFQQEKKDEAKALLENIIISKHKFYSPLALYFIIDNKLEENSSTIIIYFDEIIKINSIEKENLNLIKLKKAIYLFNLDDEGKIIETLNPIINSNSVWKETAINLISDYFKSKNQQVKADEYLNLLNSR